MKLTFHEDPGHGWLEVPHSMIEKLGISSQISSCSYQDARNAYLEEDCDLSLFVNACRTSDRYDWTVDWRTKFSDPCFVRDLDHYRPLNGSATVRKDAFANLFS